MTKTATLRASQHSGREGSGRHNDRSFLAGRSADWIREHADHIDPSRTSDNQVYTWDGQTDIERSERAWYDRTYAKAQEKTNSRYIREGHPDRCKTTADLYDGKLTRPEEMILQVGNRDVRADDQAFINALNDYLNRLDEWNQAHGDHMTILSMALHVDETTPHVHIRRVWDYQDRDGLTRLGQNKALEQAGVELPDPSKPVGRYNNRKMTFDRSARAMWQEACRAHGLEIETEPVPDRRHQDKADYIRGQISQEIDALTAQRDGLRAEADRLAQDIKKARQQARQASQEAQKLRAERDKLTSERDELSRQTDEARETWTQAVKVARDASARADGVTRQADRLTGDLKKLISEKDKLQAELDGMTLTKTTGDLPQNDRFDEIEAEAKPTLLDKSKVTISTDSLKLLLTWSRSAWRDRKSKERSDQELVYAQGRAREASRTQSLSSIQEQIENVKARDVLDRYQTLEQAYPDVFKQMDELQERETWTRELEADREDALTR